MNFILQPWQLLILILAGWINRPQLSSGLGRKRPPGSAWNRDYQETRSSFGFVDHTASMPFLLSLGRALCGV
jgi:hypothetical protein